MHTLADEAWGEDNNGWAAPLRRHAAGAGVSARIAPTAAADTLSKLALRWMTSPSGPLSVTVPEGGSMISTLHPGSGARPRVERYQSHTPM